MGKQNRQPKITVTEISSCSQAKAQAKETDSYGTKAQTTEPDSRFTVPREHIYYEELTALFDSEVFKFLKAGFDQFQIPFYFMGSKFYMDEKESQLTALYDMDAVENGHVFFVHSHITPCFHKLLQAKITKTTVTAEMAEDAYQFLRKVSKAYQEATMKVSADTEKAENTETAEITGMKNFEAGSLNLWECFHALLILAKHLWCFRRVSCYRDAYLKDWNTVTFSLHFFIDPEEADSNTDNPEVKTWGKRGLEMLLVHFDHEELFEVFDEIKALYFLHARNRYRAANNNRITEQIIADYHELAEQKHCCLEFRNYVVPIKLLTYNDNEVRYKLYSLNPNGPNSLLALMADIKGALSKSTQLDDGKVSAVLHSAKIAIDDTLPSGRLNHNYPH